MYLLRKLSFSNNSNSSTRMKGSCEEVHGFRGDHQWTNPRVVAYSNEANRADQGNTIAATEFLDEPDVLEAKIQLLAQLIKEAKSCVAYTGAGLSRAAGIGDYASKAKDSLMANVPKLRSSLDAQPTYAHKVLVALERSGYLHHYVQQNHDGLPQKAGFPQEKINEIHGGWYDPANPVVQFSGNLRSDLFDWMLDIEQNADLCLCLGTSLSGMNADRIASTPAKKSLKKNSNVLGTVIINLQQTRLDSKCAIRIWAKLDDVFARLSELLHLDLTPVSVDPPAKYNDQFPVPYNANGVFDPDSRMIWDLRDKQKIKITNPDASNFNAIGEIYQKDNYGNYSVLFSHPEGKLSSPVLGKWWVNCVMEGKWPYHLPFVNCEPRFLPSHSESDTVESDTVESLDMQIENANFSIVQTHNEISDGNHEWSVSVQSSAPHLIEQVTWILHKTFSPSTITCTSAPFTITRSGWGVFTVRAHIQLSNGKLLKAKHKLSFEFDQSESVVF